MSDGLGARVVKDQSGGQPLPYLLRQMIAQLDAHERVEPKVTERGVHVDRLRGRIGKDSGRHVAYDAAEGVEAPLSIELAEPVRRRQMPRRGNGFRRERTEALGQAGLPSYLGDPGAVDLRRDDARNSAGNGLQEQNAPNLGFKGQQASTREAQDVTLTHLRD